MKVKIIPEKRYLTGEFYNGDILDDKIYKVIGIEKHNYYRIIDESGEDYLYPGDMFEVIEDDEK